MEKNYFIFLSSTSAFFALFTTFCLYDNFSGITMPIFVVGTLYYLTFSMKKFNVILKKSAWLYKLFIILLGISTFLTNDLRIILFNYIGLFLLFISFMLHQFYEDEKWGIGKYILNILKMIVYTFGNFAEPFIDYFEYRNTMKKKDITQVKNILIGIGVGIPLLIIVLVLLMSADIVFGQIFDKFFGSISIPTNLIGIMFMIIIMFLLSYAFMSKIKKQDQLSIDRIKVSYEPIIAITFNALLLFVYLIFSVIQIVYLFLGMSSLPDGFTYAQYAREGFFQLLFVCVINLLLVLLTLNLFKQSKVLKGILIAISLCTFIMIASSTMRMLIYISTYGLTFLRIFVLWSLLTILLLMIGVLLLIVKQSFDIFRYEMIVISVLYLCLAFSHPDFLIASYNLKNLPKNLEENASQIDMNYLSNLSSDAAIVINAYNENTIDKYWVNQYFEHIKDDTKDIGIRNFNISRWIGNELANK